MIPIADFWFALAFTLIVIGLMVVLLGILLDMRSGFESQGGLITIGCVMLGWGAFIAVVKALVSVWTGW